MKNLIPYVLFEGKIEDKKEKILKQKIMRYFESKYLDKFTSEIGEIVNKWLKRKIVVVPDL